MSWPGAASGRLLVRLLVHLLLVTAALNAELRCPPHDKILPCRCLMRGEEFQVWCSHSELHRVLEGLKSLGQYVHYPIDELILENNNLPALPGRTFAPLNILRLMLRNNGLERVSSDWLTGLESSLLELYIVEPALRSFPEDALHQIIALEAVTIESELLKRVPDFSGLPRLRHLHIDTTSLIDLPPRNFRSLPLLENLHISGSLRLTRLESGLLQDLPRLKMVNISQCGISNIHPRSFNHLPSLTELILTGNKISDAGMVGRATRDLPSLTILRIDYNNIDKLEGASFVDLPVLKNLYLGNNRITELYHGAFHRVPSLRTLDLSKNLIRRIHPESFISHSGSGVEELWMSDNNIDSIGELRALLDALPRLIYLDLSYNYLQEIPFGALRGHPTLEQLHLNHNKIHLIEREALVAMPALRELRLKNNSLANLLDAPFWNLPALKGLDLSQNYYRRLEPRLLANIPSLRRVDFSENLLTIIDPTTFLNTPALEHVNLSYNTLASIHPATFRHLINLYELDVSANSLSDFVPGLPRGIENLFMKKNQMKILPMVPSPDLDLPSLRILDISANGLQRIPFGTLRTLPQLRRLYLGHNNIKNMEDGSLNGLSRLESLNLEENRLMIIHPNVLKEMIDLQELNLQGNLLELIRPELLLNTKHLKKLDISHNHLTDIIIGTLDSTRDLQMIDASYNSLAEFSHSFRGLKHLKYLDLTNNRIKDIKADVLSTLTSLKELRMSYNLLREVHKGSFVNLQNLNMLYMDNNEIELIESQALRALPSLTVIKMNNNRLQEIPDSTFSELPSLQMAELQDNKLRIIANNAFYHVPQLLFLNLSNNLLAGLEDAGLRSMRSLEILDLSNNRLSRVATNELEKMEWLVELKMSNNEICGILGSSFNNLLRLRVLSLRNNKIMTIPESAVQKLRSNIAILDVDGNPLQCSCSMLWLRTWLQETGSKGPHCSDGSLLRELRLSRQECMAEQRTPEPVAPGCEAELLSGPSYSTSQVFSPWMEIKEQTTPKSNLQMAPSPEESDYFYDEYVDYPYNESNIIDQNNTLSNNIKQEPTTSTTTTAKPQKSSHYIAGDTPTIYAAPNKNKQKQTQDVPKAGASGIPSPSSSGFTFFGVPLPSINLNKLWPLAKKNAERKTDVIRDRNGSGRGNLFPPTNPEIQTGGFIPILPGSGGFKPMLNPPNLGPDPISNNQQSNIVTTTTIRPSLLLTDITEEYLSKKGVTSKIINVPTTVIPLTVPATASSNQITYNSIPNLPEDASEKNKTNYYSHEEITVFPVELHKTSTKKNEVIKDLELEVLTAPPEVEIITENDSFEKIFHEVVENIPVPNLTTISPEETKTVSYTEVITQSSKRNSSKKLNRIAASQNPGAIQNPIPSTINSASYNSKASNLGASGSPEVLQNPQKDDPTPLSVLVAPGAQLPPYRASGKSTITKVFSPHLSSTASLLSPLNATEPLPVLKERRIFSNVNIEELTSQMPPHDGSMSWYYTNYNKTNLQPYVDPAINAYTENHKPKVEASIFTVVVVLSLKYFL